MAYVGDAVAVGGDVRSSRINEVDGDFGFYEMEKRGCWINGKGRAYDNE